MWFNFNSSNTQVFGLIVVLYTWGTCVPGIVHEQITLQYCTLHNSANANFYKVQTVSSLTGRAQISTGNSHNWLRRKPTPSTGTKAGDSEMPVNYQPSEMAACTCLILRNVPLIKWFTPTVLFVWKTQAQINNVLIKYLVTWWLLHWQIFLNSQSPVHFFYVIT